MKVFACSFVIFSFLVLNVVSEKDLRTLYGQAFVNNFFLPVEVYVDVSCDDVNSKHSHEAKQCLMEPYLRTGTFKYSDHICEMVSILMSCVNNKFTDIYLHCILEDYRNILTLYLELTEVMYDTICHDPKGMKFFAGFMSEEGVKSLTCKADLLDSIAPCRRTYLDEQIGLGSNCRNFEKFLRCARHELRKPVKTCADYESVVNLYESLYKLQMEDVKEGYHPSCDWPIWYEEAAPLQELLDHHIRSDENQTDDDSETAHKKNTNYRTDSKFPNGNFSVGLNPLSYLFAVTVLFVILL